jgi:hypothetical protein
VVTTTPDNIVITATDIAGNTETHNVAIIAMDKLAVTITSNKPKVIPTPLLLLVKVGFVMSTLTDKTLEVELVLPTTSIAHRY